MPRPWGHVFAPGEHRGVFKTTDGGRTWTRMLFVERQHGRGRSGRWSRGAPDVLYAATWQAYRTPWSLSERRRGQRHIQVYDGGAHWTNISPPAPACPTSCWARSASPWRPAAPNVVYAADSGRRTAASSARPTAATTWTRVNAEWKLRQRAFYYMAIFADPTDPNTVYMPQVDGLFVSHDGARTFTALHPPHGDNHIVWINPHDPKILLEGNDGGATVSTDGGKTWSTEHNQPTGQFYHVNLDDRFPFHLYGAQQDEGSTGGPSATGQGNIPLAAWVTTAYGESTPSVPEPGNPDVTFGSGYFSIFLRRDQATEESQSVSPWPNYQEGASSGELTYRFAWTHPIVFSPADPRDLFVGSQYVMQSGDHGHTWRTISPDLTRNDPATERPSGGPIDLDQSSAEVYPYVSAIAVSPLDGHVVWAGSSDGLVHVTTDGGAHWQAVTPPTLPAWADVGSIEPSHVDRGTAYLTVQRYMWDDFTPYVFRTNDLGRHWTPITDGLPRDEYAFTIRQDPADSSLLFLTTKTTVYVSLDGGARWRPLSLDLPPVQVRDVAVDDRQGDVVIATHGRAFWILDNLALLEEMTVRPAPSADSAALFAPQGAWLTHAYGTEGRGGDDAGQNPPFGATVFFHIPAGYDGRTPVTIAFTDSTGRAVRQFALHRKTGAFPTREALEQMTPAGRDSAAETRLTAIEPGMNEFQWDLRHPDATEIRGFEPPIAAGGLPDEVDGPTVLPGHYHVVLTYGGRAMTESFEVMLDPRIHTPQSDLAAELALRLRIHVTLDSLDRSVNRALAVRGRLAAGSPQAAALDSAIDDVVQLDMHSSEGSLLHETKLRSHLAYLAADIDLAYAAPTPAQFAVFDELARQARAGEERIEAAIRGSGAIQ